MPMQTATKVEYACSRCGVVKKGPRIALEDGKLVCHDCYQKVKIDVTDEPH